MATFKQMIEEPENVAQTSFPFTYLSHNEYYYFRNDNTMVLKGLTDVAVFGAFDSIKFGRLHFIVKPNKEVRVRFHSDKAGWFGWRTNLSDDTISKFDIEIDSPVFTNPLGTNSSTMDVTMRGGSMLALNVGNRGDRGVWSTSGDEFHLETVHRDAVQPNETSGDDSMYLSLTAPYNDYSILTTKSLTWNQHVSTMWVQILEVKDVDPTGGFADLTDFETTDDELILEDSQLGSTTFDYGEKFNVIQLYETGTDQDGNAWTISIAEEWSTEQWVVLVDGAIVSSGFDDYELAKEAARLKVTGLNARKSEEVEDGFGLEILGGASILLLIAVGLLFVYGFAKGKGGA